MLDVSKVTFGSEVRFRFNLYNLCKGRNLTSYKKIPRPQPHRNIRHFVESIKISHQPTILFFEDDIVIFHNNPDPEFDILRELRFYDYAYLRSFNSNHGTGVGH